jgi:hypothetical protein
VFIRYSKFMHENKSMSYGLDVTNRTPRDLQNPKLDTPTIKLLHENGGTWTINITDAKAVPLPYVGYGKYWDASDNVCYLKWNLQAKAHHANEKRVTST